LRPNSRVFDVPGLRGRLDDQVTVGLIVEIGGDRDPLQCGIAFGVVQLSCRDRAVRGGLNPAGVKLGLLKYRSHGP
jgi:hypothetical protein